MSEEGKVGLGDEAKLSYQLDKKMESREVKGSVKIWELHSDVYRDNSSDSFCCLLSLPSRVHIYFSFCHFARPASRKTQLWKNCLSTLRNTRVFGDARVNFTTKVTVVNFPSTDWFSYLRTQLKAICGWSLFAKEEIFLSAVFSNKFFRLKQIL